MVLFWFGGLADVKQTDFNHNIFFKKCKKNYIFFFYKVSQQKKKKKILNK